MLAIAALAAAGSAFAAGDVGVIHQKLEGR
jgi:hypothetical protein